MDLGQQLFQLVSNPSIAYLALIVGLFMLFVAVTTPGTGVAEVIAFIALAIAAIGLINLSANFSGVLFIVVGFVLFVIDATATAHGALTIGGAISLLVGSLLLFPVREGSEGLSGWLIGGVTLATAGLSAVILSALMRVRQQKRVDHVAQNIVGTRGVIKTEVKPNESGTAQIGGQLWTVAADEPIEPGAEVEVVNRVGLTLQVKRLVATDARPS
ncbi:MAG: NfeD family protein [Anaerolineae bacterium]